VTEAVENSKKGRDDFFSKFENTELKQEAPIRPKPEVINIVKTENVVQPVTNGVDKLTVNLEEQATINKAPAKKVNFYV